jgi:hypothetical protein
VLAAEPSPAPQMVQPRRRPPSLVLVQWETNEPGVRPFGWSLYIFQEIG